MNSDEAWRVVDAERLAVADLVATDTDWTAGEGAGTVGRTTTGAATRPEMVLTMVVAAAASVPVSSTAMYASCVARLTVNPGGMPLRSPPP